MCGRLLTCLINGSKVRSIDFVFTSCNSLDGFLHSSRKPAIAFCPTEPPQAAQWKSQFFSTSNFSDENSFLYIFFFASAIKSLFRSLAKVLTARKTPAKWGEENSILLKFSFVPTARVCWWDGYRHHHVSSKHVIESVHEFSIFFRRLHRWWSSERLGVCVGGDLQTHSSHILIVYSDAL